MNTSPPSKEPPQLKTCQLWFSLLSPFGATVILLILMATLSSILDLSFTIILLTTLTCWVWFNSLILERYRGRGACILTLAYPIAQFIICGTTFFFGCLALYRH